MYINSITCGSGNPSGLRTPMYNIRRFFTVLHNRRRLYRTEGKDRAKMGLINEIGMVLVVAVILSFIGMSYFLFWSFLFALFFSTAIATFIARRFAGGQKTMGSHGRYVKTSTVYLFFMVGIIISSIIGSEVASYLVEKLNQNDSLQIFLLSLIASFLMYALVKSGLY